MTYVADDDPDLQEWLAWVERDGRGAFAAWMATHPAYLVTEPLRDPERTFNNALGDRSFYAPIDQREVPLVSAVLVPDRWVALAVVAVVAAWATWRRRWGSPLLLVGAVTVALAAPHGLVSWHTDGMETARHLVVPALQLYLGALLMVVGVARLGRSEPTCSVRTHERRDPAIDPPSRRATAGGVVVVQEAFGVTEHIEDVCQRFADAGWLAVAPHLFHRTGDPVLDHTDFDAVRPHMEALTAEGIATDVDAALDYIEGAGFPPNAAGIVGFCMGGSVALATATRRQLGAAVTFYGGGVIQGAVRVPTVGRAGPGAALAVAGPVRRPVTRASRWRTWRLSVRLRRMRTCPPRSCATQTPGTASTGMAAPPTTPSRPRTPGCALSTGLRAS